MTEEQKYKSLIKRLIRTFIIVISLIIIILGLRFGIPRMYYITIEKLDAKSDLRTLLKNEYCVFYYEVNNKSIINKQPSNEIKIYDTANNRSSELSTSMDNSSKCVDNLKFDNKYLYFKADRLILKARYKVKGKYEMEIIESSDQEILKIKKYNFTITNNGLNIFGDNLKIKAWKINK